MEPIDRDVVRQEGLAAFVHDVRTPLTSMRIVMELGQSNGNGGEMGLDRELVAMLRQSLDELHHLVDALQETTWLERGRRVLVPQPCSLQEVLTAVQARLAVRNITVAVSGGEGVQGTWDVPRLEVALAGLAEAANRGGHGDGRVSLTVEKDEAGCRITLLSGTAGLGQRPIGSDLGSGFFRGYTLLTAMGGEVQVDRQERYVRIEAQLPLE